MGVRALTLDKRCGLCGDELQCVDCGGGSVWSCGRHGVRDWVFAGQGGSGTRGAGRFEAGLRSATRAAALLDRR